MNNHRKGTIIFLIAAVLNLTAAIFPGIGIGINYTIGIFSIVLIILNLSIDGKKYDNNKIKYKKKKQEVHLN